MNKYFAIGSETSHPTICPNRQQLLSKAVGSLSVEGGNLGELSSAVNPQEFLSQLACKAGCTGYKEWRINFLGESMVFKSKCLNTELPDMITSKNIGSLSE